MDFSHLQIKYQVMVHTTPAPSDEVGEGGGRWGRGVSKLCGLNGRVSQKPQEPIKPRKETDEGRLVTSVETRSGLAVTVESLCRADGKECMWMFQL